MGVEENFPCSFDRISGEVLDLILARLPVTTLLTAGQVCKDWSALIRSRRFIEFYDKVALRKSWFFQCCVNYLCPAKNQGYGYEPETKKWHLISSQCFPTDRGNAFAGSPDGCLYSIFSLTDLSYKRELLSNLWERAPAMHNSRNSPLLGLVESESESSSATDLKSHKLIVAGGVSFFEEDDLAVEIYDSSLGSWELCQSLPVEFRGNCSRHWMTSAIAKGKFYIAEKYSGSTAVLDSDTKVWSSVKTLRPPGVVHSHLLSCQGRLLLAGSCYVNDSHSFKIWEVNEETMECGPILASMASELLSSCFDAGEDGQERKGEGLQCVAYGDLIYVFFPIYFRELTRDNQVVVCDLSSGSSVSWTLLPPLPATASYNHVVGLTSPVKLEFLVRQHKEEEEETTRFSSPGRESEMSMEIQEFQRLMGHFKVPF
ncbi:unnamed protein product [Calypogeia fissa]